MLEPAIIAARLLQYVGAAILFGSSLFFAYALLRPERVRWARPLVATGAALLALSSAFAIGAQASLFAGSFAEGLTAEAMGEVVAWMDSGKAAAFRAVIAALAAISLFVLPAGRSRWLVAAGLGTVATASLAWLGHGAATEGTLGSLHLVSNILHMLAAAIWVGALVCFAGLLFERRPVPDETLHAALVRFSGFGPVLVAILVLTGLVNAWILVGPARALELWDTPYGRLLAIKLALFLAMLALAALNRFRHTAALLTDRLAAIGALKRSITAETAAGLAVLFLVAWLGTLAPPAAA